MVQPIGPLMWEHRLIEKILPLIQKEANKIEKNNEADPVFIDATVDFFRVYADRTHHGKEEDILFRELGLKKINPEHQQIMDELIHEHTQARSKVKRLYEANQKWKKGDHEALKTIHGMLLELAAFYPEHIAKEDKRFFHPSMTYFTSSEQETMLQEFYSFDQNMIHWKYQKIIEWLGGEASETESAEPKKDRYKCAVCGYIYDPAKGDPEHGVKPGTSFKDLPADWVCPICYADKPHFKMI